jgi:6-pyruvoyltetrahydropterin/6-carboxytetrahydropterin synthase
MTNSTPILQGGNGMKIRKTFTFDAAHCLPLHEGKCKQLHGHTWKLTVCVEGVVNERTGFVIDFNLLKDIVNRSVINRLDHKFLGMASCLPELDESHYADCCKDNWMFYPTRENLLIWIWEELILANVLWNSLTLAETETCSATLTYAEYTRLEKK